MKSELTKLFFLRKYFCIFLFWYFFHGIVAAERSGLLYFKFLCYKNPDNKLPSGKVCDLGNPSRCPPIFTICISAKIITSEIKEKNCNVYYQKTRTYETYDLICNNLHGSSNYLEIDIKKEILASLKETYFVKIEVRNDPWRLNQLIASFRAEFNQIPSTDLSKVVYKNMSMYRTEPEYANPNVSLDISMALYENRKSVSGINFHLIFGLFFGILVLNIIIVIAAYCITRRRDRRLKRPQNNDKKPMNKKERDRKDYTLPAVLNQPFPNSENDYDEIDEKCTYGNLDNEKDYYLIPLSKTKTLPGKLQVHNADNLKRSEEHGTNQSKEAPIEIDAQMFPQEDFKKI